MNMFIFKSSLLLIISLTLTYTAFGVSYTCRQHGITVNTTFSDYNNGKYNIINSSCGTMIDKHWKSFGMKKKYWDQGWGFHNACSTNTPLNRTFRALELLRISKNSAKPSNAHLNFAYSRSKSWIDELRVTCAKDSNNGAVASHGWGFWEWAGGDNGDGVVYLYQNVFAHSIIYLASTVVHEARHKIKGHNAGSNAGHCSWGGSCDTSYSYNGANAYELGYGWWYGVASKNSTIFSRQMALDYARDVQNQAFKYRPNFNIHTTAW